MFIPSDLFQEAQIKQDQFPCPLEVLLLSLDRKVQIHVHKQRKLLHPLSCFWSAKGQRNEALTQTVLVIEEQRQGLNKRLTLYSFFSSEHIKCSPGSDKWSTLGSILSPTEWKRRCYFISAGNLDHFSVVCFPCISQHPKLLSWPISKAHPCLILSVSLCWPVAHQFVYYFLEPADTASANFCGNWF